MFALNGEVEICWEDHTGAGLKGLIRNDEPQAYKIWSALRKALKLWLTTQHGMGTRQDDVDFKPEEAAAADEAAPTSPGTEHAADADADPSTGAAFSDVRKNTVASPNSMRTANALKWTEDKLIRRHHKAWGNVVNFMWERLTDDDFATVLNALQSVDEIIALLIQESVCPVIFRVFPPDIIKLGAHFYDLLQESPSPEDLQALQV